MTDTISRHPEGRWLSLPERIRAERRGVITRTELAAAVTSLDIIALDVLVAERAA